MSMVNIKGLNKAQLLNMMATRTEIVSMYWGLQQGNSSPEEVAVQTHVDYYNGVKIGVDFNHDEVYSGVYNRDAGLNMMERIVAQLRKEEAEKQVKQQQKKNE